MATAETITSPPLPSQWLVSFENKTFVFNNYAATNVAPHEKELQLLSFVSQQTHWPVHRLVVSRCAYPLASVRTISSLRGGKGGFGTLLKGQGRQSGARHTTDFGACRDLQGRRLRHVNDEIKLRKWREAMEKKEAGEATDDDGDYPMKTASGIFNWHLMTPSWSDLSKKATNKLQRNLKRQFQQFQSEQDKVLAAKKAKEDAYHQSVDAYVRQTNEAASTLKVSDAIQQGLKAKKKRRRDESNYILPDAEQLEPNSLITLSGDLVVEESEDGWKVQSQSDFGTMAVVLDSLATTPSASLYYEAHLETAGVAQVGWAHLPTFLPNTETGDGVGDDAASYAVDASRCLKFHAGTEEVYGPSVPAKSGDVLGCFYDIDKQTISYTLNGQDLGVAFTLSSKSPPLLLVPAISCNQGEILDLKFSRDQMKYFSVTDESCNVVPVHQFMEKQAGSTLPRKSEGSEVEALTPAAVTTSSKIEELPADTIAAVTTTESEPLSSDMNPISVDLDNYDSALQLRELGMERLKAALLTRQCKGGGTLEERAQRLFSLKGLKRSEYPQKVRGRDFFE